MFPATNDGFPGVYDILKIAEEKRKITPTGRNLCGQREKYDNLMGKIFSRAEISAEEASYVLTFAENNELKLSNKIKAYCDEVIIHEKGRRIGHEEMAEKMKEMIDRSVGI